MNVPEMKKAVDQRIKYLERQLSAARNFFRSLEEEGLEPPTDEKRSTGRSRGSKPARVHPQAQDGITHRDYIRSLLRKYEAGLTPSEIRKLSTDGGRKIPDSYPYEQLATLKKDKEVKKVGPKYLSTKVGGEAKAAAAA